MKLINKFENIAVQNDKQRYLKAKIKALCTVYNINFDAGNCENLAKLVWLLEELEATERALKSELRGKPGQPLKSSQNEQTKKRQRNFLSLSIF